MLLGHMAFSPARRLGTTVHRLTQSAAAALCLVAGCVRGATRPAVEAPPSAAMPAAVIRATSSGTVEPEAAVRVQVNVRFPGFVVGDIMLVPNYPVLVIGPAHDSTVVRTDEVGGAALTLRPGHYRIAPLRRDAVDARQRYEWDVEFDVAPGMRPVNLTAANARRRAR